MDIWDLFFGAGPAVHTIMKLGFMPKDEDFLELTTEQYLQFFEKEGYNISTMNIKVGALEKLLTFI